MSAVSDEESVTLSGKVKMLEGAESSRIIPNSMWFVACLIILPSFSFGYVFSCLNSCLVVGSNNSGGDCYNGSDSSCPAGTIYNDINLTTIEAQMATSLTVVGAWIGCMIASSPSEKYGKRITLLCNNAFFISGALLSAAGPVSTLFIGRFISGLGVGVASSIPSVLLSEIATDQTRGTITTLHQVAITLGIFVAALLGYAFVTYLNHGWQYIQALGALPGILMLVMQAYIPESPKWLLKHADSAQGGQPRGRSNSAVDNLNLMEAEVHDVHNSHSRSGSRANSTSNMDSTPNPMLAGTGNKGAAAGAGKDGTDPHALTHPEGRGRAVSAATAHATFELVLASLTRLRAPGHDVEAEMQAIIAAAREEVAEIEDASQVSWEEVMVYKKSLIVGIGLMLFQALTGINSVTFYSTTIFGLAGFDESIIGTASFGAVNLLVTILSSYLIDRMGRKILLLIGTYIMLGALLLLSIVLISPIPGVVQGLIAVLAVLIFVTGFALGLGAVVWAVMSELMPTRLRVKAISLFLSVNWGSNLVVGLLTLSAIDGLGGVQSGMDDEEKEDAEKKGVALMYFVFAGITALCLAFLHLYVPETKGKTPEQILNLGKAGVMKPLLAEGDADEHDSGSDKADAPADAGAVGAAASGGDQARRRTSKGS